jgi:hypothetical protein
MYVRLSSRLLLDQSLSNPCATKNSHSSQLPNYKLLMSIVDFRPMAPIDRIAVGLSLAYIGTTSSTTQRDEFDHRSRRFRLGDKKQAAGVCRGRGWYRYIHYKYEISMACFLIG